MPLCSNKVFNINFDLFSEPYGLYFEGKKKNSFFGTVASFIFLVIYIISIVISVALTYNRNYGNFYDTEIHTRFPSINIIKDFFSFTFGMEVKETYDEYIDDTIFTMNASFIRSYRENGIWNWKNVQLDIGRCEITDFGKEFYDLFMAKPLSNVFCIKNINFPLEGHFSVDNYTMIKIQVFPCINSTKNNFHCKPIETIYNIINGNLVTMNFETFALNPANFKEPTEPKIENLFTSVSQGQYKSIYIYWQILEVQTDVGMLFEKIKTKKYLVYDKTISVENLVNSNNSSLCDIEIKLSDTKIIHKRTYERIWSVFRNTGGLMDFIKVLFNIIVIVPINYFFERNLLNDLFNYNFNEKKLVFKSIPKFNEDIKNNKNKPNKTQDSVYNNINESSMNNKIPFQKYSNLINKNNIVKNENSIPIVIVHNKNNNNNNNNNQIKKNKRKRLKSSTVLISASKQRQIAVNKSLVSSERKKSRQLMNLKGQNLANKKSQDFRNEIKFLHEVKLSFLEILCFNNIRDKGNNNNVSFFDEGTLFCRESLEIGKIIRISSYFNTRFTSVKFEI